MPPELLALAAAQGGCVTRRQALAAGLDEARVRRLLRREWVALYRCVYADRAAVAAADERGRHVLLAAARVLTSRLDLHASHRTAAVVHGLPLLGPLPLTPQTTRPPAKVRDRSSSRHEKVAPLPASHRAVVTGVPATSLARTAVDVARTRPYREAVVVADAALRAGATREELRAVLAACHDWPGARAAADPLAFADPRADGPLESITRCAYAAVGLPPPLTQVVLTLHGTFLGLVDFCWPELRVVGEADGLAKYQGDALRQEKVRELGIGRAGFEVVRSVWADAWTPDGQRELGALVRGAMERAPQRPVVPGVAWRQPSLDELLRVRSRRAA